VQAVGVVVYWNDEVWAWTALLKQQEQEGARDRPSSRTRMDYWILRIKNCARLGVNCHLWEGGTKRFDFTDETLWLFNPPIRAVVMSKKGPGPLAYTGTISSIFPLHQLHPISTQSLSAHNWHFWKFDLSWGIMQVDPLHLGMINCHMHLTRCLLLPKL